MNRWVIDGDDLGPLVRPLDTSDYSEDHRLRGFPTEAEALKSTVSSIDTEIARLRMARRRAASRLSTLRRGQQ